MTQPNSIVIPGYRIERKLGQGGMATVYLAIQESFDREVALKIMSPFLNSDPSFTTRFVREARIVSQIHHASIVPVMDVGEHQTHHYLSMEYLPGGDLKHRIAENKHGLSLAVNTCLAISAALDVAHRKGFVHRDIKPENILFREDDTPVLTDFGIARAIDAGTSLTLAGMMVGTPNYMSPEQVKGHELDGRSDLYSLGIVFYETLTGNVPFRADSTMSLALKHLSDPLPPLPPEFALYQPFIDRLTAKEREDRFASGAEVARALRLINEMANPRVNPALRPSLSPTLPPVMSPTVNLSVPQQGDAYDPTLVTPRRPATTATPVVTSPAAVIPQLAAAATPAAKAKPAKVARAPRPPSRLALALKAAGPALFRSLANAGRSSTAAAMHGWGKLRSLKLPVRRPPAPHAAAAGMLAKPATTRTHASFAAWLRTFSTNPQRSRHVAWAALGMGAVAFGFGGYLFSRPGAPLPQAKLVQPAPVPKPIPVAAPPSTVVAPAMAETPSEEVLALLQRLTTERETLASVQSLFTRARIREERVAAKLRREEARKQQEEARLAALKRSEDQRLANEQRVKELLTLAKNDIADGHMYLPAGSSAADRYLEVLRIDASHPDAMAAHRKIGELLIAESDRYLKVGQTAEAEALIGRLRSLQPQNPRLVSLETRLQSAQPVELTRRDQARLADTAKKIDRANDTLDKKNRNLRELDLASDAYKDATKLLPESPRLETLRERIVVSFAAATKAQLDENDVKEARKLVDMARKRDLFGPDLERWESLLNEADKR